MKRSAEIRAWLVAEFARRLKKEAKAIDTRAALTSFEIDSLEAVEVVVELESFLGRPLEPTLLWRYPDIEALSEALAASGGKPL